jgi:hypothetical protein
LQNIALIDQCAAHVKNTTFLSNVKVVFLPATAFRFGNHPCIQVPLQKTADCSHDRWGLLRDAAQMKLDELSAVDFIAEVWRLITPTAIKNCFVKCGFLIDHVRSNDYCSETH